VRTYGFHQGDVVTAELVRMPVGDQECADHFPFRAKGDTHDRLDALGCHSSVAGLQMRFGLVHQVVGALGWRLAGCDGAEHACAEGHADVAEESGGCAVGHSDVGLTAVIVVQAQVGDVAADQ
jgi:hypothetical protein